MWAREVADEVGTTLAAGILSGAFVVEHIFNIPGMGRLLVNSVILKDFIIVQATVIVIAILVLLANLLVDLSYGWLDPRIHHN